MRYMHEMKDPFELFSPDAMKVSQTSRGRSVGRVAHGLAESKGGIG